ncbi:MAG: hypothetical protein J6X78_00015 [Treponema sp.]|nr:hypothetical protein [Treponema sp.]
MKKLYNLICCALLFLLIAGCSKKTQENQASELQEQVSETSVKSEENLPPEKGTYAYIKTIKSKQEYKEAVKDLTQDYLMGRWSIEVISEDLNFVYFSFDEDGTYYVFSPYGGYMGQNGKYKLDGNSLTLFFPNFESSRWDELIFPGKKETTLVYDYDFIDFYEVGVLRNEHLILRKGVEARPARTKCILKGMEVIKTDNTPVVAKDNLKLRHQPSLKGKEGSFWYRAYLNAELRELLEKKFHQVNENDEKMVLNVMLKGMVTSYNAKTVREDTIDGITAPWYMISLFDYDDESMPQDYWVFGGYLEPFEQSRKDEYKEILFNSALEKKLLVYDEEAYQDYEASTGYKRVTGITEESAKVLIKAGGTAESDDVLQGTIFKIGMSKDEVIKLLDKPIITKDNRFDYFIFPDGYGYRLCFYFEADKVSKIEISPEK